jgi:exopolysaccharide biosynthesis polyprenyl glycosylphosphotransferase
MRRSAEAETTTGPPLEVWFAGEMTAPLEAVRDHPRPRGLLGRVNGVAVLLVAVDGLALLVMASCAGLTAAGALALAGTLLGVRASGRIYRRRLWLSWLQDLPRSLATTAIAFAAVSVAVLAAGLPPAMLVPVKAGAVVFLAVSEPARMAVFAFGRWCRRRFGRCDRTIVIGAGQVGTDLAEVMLRHPEYGLRPVGFIDPEPPGDRQLPAELLHEDLAAAIERLGVGTVVIAFSHARDSPLVDAAVTAHRLGCSTLVVPRMFELHQDGPDVERLRSYPLLRLGTAPTGRPTWWIKRVVERALAALALTVLAPLLAVCALAVLVESGRPFIFKQVRVGMDDRKFVIYKLRSVRQTGVDDSDVRWSVEGDARVGPVGRFLRRTSLDELPQLWNVLRGDMCIVGPRPERPGFVRQFSAVHELYWARHRVPTGLTGLAQVHGLRGDTSIVDRSRYDNYYIANWSLWLDVKIVLLTVGELCCRRNR